jgi:hypothetical protein
MQAHTRRSTARLVMAGLAVAGAAATVMLWWRAESGSPGGGLGGPALALSVGRLAGLLAGSALILQLLLAARLPCWNGGSALTGCWAGIDATAPSW